MHKSKNVSKHKQTSYGMNHTVSKLYRMVLWSVVYSWDSVVCSGWFLPNLISIKFCCMIILLQLLLCKQKLDLLIFEYLDIWLLSNSVLDSWYYVI